MSAQQARVDMYASTCLRMHSTHIMQSGRGQRQGFLIIKACVPLGKLIPELVLLPLEGKLIITSANRMYSGQVRWKQRPANPF